MESLKNWMVETANIMFDDSKNDLRSLAKNCKASNFNCVIFYMVNCF